MHVIFILRCPHEALENISRLIAIVLDWRGGKGVVCCCCMESPLCSSEVESLYCLSQAAYYSVSSCHHNTIAG